MVVANHLLRLPEQQISLDTIGDAIGLLAVSGDEVDELFTWLEHRNKKIGGFTPETASAS